MKKRKSSDRSHCFCRVLNFFPLGVTSLSQGPLLYWISVGCCGIFLPVIKNVKHDVMLPCSASRFKGYRSRVGCT